MKIQLKLTETQSINQFVTKEGGHSEFSNLNSVLSYTLNFILFYFMILREGILADNGL